jgi:biotin transporter BioY
MAKSLGKEAVDQGLHLGVSTLLAYLTGAVWIGIVVGFIRENGSHAKEHGQVAFLWNDIVDDNLHRVTFRSVFKGTRLDLIFWALGGPLGWVIREWW